MRSSSLSTCVECGVPSPLYLLTHGVGGGVAISGFYPKGKRNELLVVNTVSTSERVKIYGEIRQ